MLDAAVQWSGIALGLATVAGLALRRRLGHLALLPLLLIAVAASTALPLLRSEFRTWEFWTWRECAHVALLFLMGLELAVRLFFRVPHAQRVARGGIAIILLLVVLAVVASRSEPLMTGLVPRLGFALVWLYAGLLVVARIYIVPIDPLHNAVLRGFSTYLLAYSLTWSFTGSAVRLTGIVNAIAFDLLMLTLAYAAWRRSDLPADLPERTIEHFWPWRRGRADRSSPHAAPRERRPVAAGSVAG